MAISVSDLKTAAIINFVNNGGTSSDFDTPTMYCQWINMALDDWWGKSIEMNLNLYATRAATLSVVSGTQEYAVASACMRILGLLKRDGTSPSYSYTAIVPFNESRDHYLASLSSLLPNYAIIGLSQYQWFESKQLLDGSGNWIRYVQIEPIPQESFTAVYDYTRMITKIAVPQSSETTTYLDVPDNALASLAFRVVKYANIRDQVDPAWIDRQIAMADAVSLTVHRRGLQWATNKRVVRSN